MVRDTLKKILYSVSENAKKYSGYDMIEDGILESVEIMEIVSEIEENFNLSIPPELIIPEYFASLDMLEKLVDDAKEKNNG